MNAARALRFFSTGAFLYNRNFALLAWFGLALAGALRIALAHEFAGTDTINNYKIYKHVFLHIQEHRNLYLFYPAEYGDQNLYGPIFSLVIAPFALLPDVLGVICWNVFNAAILFYAIRKLPIHPLWQFAVLVCCSHEIFNHSIWNQINALVCACVILGFCWIQEGKEGRALFVILLATFIKLYGIVGFAFFFFSKRKLAFIGWTIVWSAVFFFAPVLITSFDFLIQCYRDWYEALQIKSAKNVNLDTHYYYQDISAMGMIRRIFGVRHLKDIQVLAPAALLFLSQYLPIKHWSDLRYRLYILCSTLLFTVVFSSGSESPTYIIALPAICIWYFLQPKSKWVNAYFVFALFLTTFAYSDLFTPWLRTHVLRPYSLKALPSFITWCIIVVQIHRRQFLRALSPEAGPRFAHKQTAHEPSVHPA